MYIIEHNNIISGKWYVYGFTKFDGLCWRANIKNNKNKFKYVDRTVDFDDFGKTVFLTRKEVEKALKERENNEKS